MLIPKRAFQALLYLKQRFNGKEKSSIAKKKYLAEKTFSLVQLLLAAVGVIIITPIAISYMGFSNFGNAVVVILVTIFALVFMDKLRVSLRSGGSTIIKFTRAELDSIDEDELPIYTLMVPLHKEVEMLSQIVRRLEMMDWPADRKQVLLLLEEDDSETRNAAEAIKLPPGFRFVIVPKGKVQTKPNALNHGLQFAKGEILTIYDAEDRPDPYQLKKAYLGFKMQGKDVVCLQAYLGFHNPGDNLLTMFFAAEYSTHFKILLPGLGNSGSVVPLGGTSNHFRTQVLRELGGWDPFNVTEDAALGVDIALGRYKVGIIDSTTWEEANSRVGNWIRQRSRWIKGYMQTYLVYMRSPWTLVRKLGWLNFLTFQLVFGLVPLTMVVNPIFWAMTMVYFATGSGAIQSLYPTPVFYLAMLSMWGNLIFLHMVLTGCMLRGESGDRKAYGQIAWMLLAPFYWGLMSVAAWKALLQLILKPHYWEKTDHGVSEARIILNSSPVIATLKEKETVSEIG